jgi:hypothetical protein
MIGAHLGQDSHRPAKGQLIDPGIDHAPHGHENEEPEGEARDPQIDRRQDEQQRDRRHKEHDAKDRGADGRHPFIGNRQGGKAARDHRAVGHDPCGGRRAVLEEHIAHSIAQRDVGQESLHGERRPSIIWPISPSWLLQRVS